MAGGHIYSASLACQRDLRDCTRIKDCDDWAHERLIEFNLWSSTSCALVEGRYSLDDRLRVAGSLAAVVANLLRALRKYIARCKDCGGAIRADLEANDTTPHRDTAARQGVERTFAQVVLVTGHATKGLTDSVLWIADALMPYTSDKRALKDDYYDFRKENIEFFPTSLGQPQPGTIQHHLIEANVRRRHRFLSAPKLAAATRVVRRNVEWDQHPAEPGLRAPRWSRRSKVEYPAPPLLSPGSKTFVCPFCRQILPTFIADAIPWKRHIMADLSPFTCVFAECSSHERGVLYASRNDWEKHLNTSHGSPYWLCPHCTERLELRCEVAFREHLATAHRSAGRDSEEDLSSKVAAAFHKPRLPELSCPICPNSAERKHSLDHIANCLQNLALEAFYYPELAPRKPLYAGISSGGVDVPKISIDLDQISPSDNANSDLISRPRSKSALAVRETIAPPLLTAISEIVPRSRPRSSAYSSPSVNSFKSSPDIEFKPDDQQPQFPMQPQLADWQQRNDIEYRHETMIWRQNHSILTPISVAISDFDRHFQRQSSVSALSSG